MACAGGEIDDQARGKSADIDEIEEDLAKKFEIKRIPQEPIVENKQNKIAAKKLIPKIPPKVEKSLKISKVVPPSPPKVKRDYKGNKEFEKYDDVSRIIWGNFNPQFLHVGEVTRIDVSYLGINAASIEIGIKDVVLIDGHQSYQLWSRARSADFYNWVYEIDDLVESYVSADEFLPIKYSLAQRESNKTVDHIELYDREKLTTHFRYKRIKKGEKSFEKSDSPIPYYSHDFLSCFFFIRGMPLRSKDVYTFPVTTKGKTWLMKVEVLKRETVEVGDKKYKAVKLKAITKYSGEMAKRGTMHIWLSDDKYRKFLKFDSELKFGTVTGSLSKYTVPDLK